MNTIKLQMDNYFAGLNLSLIRRQIKNYGRLVLALDEETLSDISLSIANELNVSYDETRLSVLNGFLNDYINNEIGERTLFHCIIGACDKYSKDLPEYVLEISHKVLESIYDGSDEEHTCDCANCSNAECENSGAEAVTSYNLGTVMNGVLTGETTIMDGDVKVPLEVILTVANFMDSLNMEEAELKRAIKDGVFEGRIVETAKSEKVKEESEATSSEPKKTSDELNAEALKRAMELTERMSPGARKRMIEASKALKEIGIDVEGMITELITENSRRVGMELSQEEIATIISTVMNGSI